MRLRRTSRWLCLLALAPAALGGEQATLTRLLIERHDLTSDMEVLRQSLQARFANRPEYGRYARLFADSVAEPLRFPAPLAAFADRARQFDGAPALVAEWSAQYGVESGCEVSPLATPRSLADAVEQIRDGAATVTDLHREALMPRQRRLLKATFERVGERFRNSFHDAMNRRERRMVRRFLGALREVDRTAIVCAARLWGRFAEPDYLANLRALIARHPASDDAIVHRAASPFGEIVFGGRGAARLHLRDLLFLADLGGNDFYGIEAAGDFTGAPQFVVDFAGDDIYQSSRSGGFASGLGRVSILVDVSGDDRYRSAAHGQGSAIFGVGALIDLAGDDRYTADHHAQGAAWFGVGALFDHGGDDVYQVSAMGQGLGATEGLGVLSDMAGGDVYLALGGTPTNYRTEGLTDAWAQGVARGVRGVAPGGIGLLLDHQGDDRYDAGVFAQGGAYYRGVGQLLDYGDGDDALLGSRYNAGWGAHGGVGRYFNAAGDDRYDTRHKVIAGLAWDYSLASFHDAAGEDFYRVGGFSLAAAAHGSLAWFVDAGGNDTYVEVGSLAESETEGPNFALFVDVGGEGDTVNGRARPSSFARSGEHGFECWAEAGATPPCPFVDDRDDAAPPEVGEAPQGTRRL